jgi:hypothetical protein
MGHPQIENPTPFLFEPLFLADEEGRPLLVGVLKATYDVTPKGVVVSGFQDPLKIDGEPYEKPGASSYKYEPECSWLKPATDVVLIGSAVVARPGMTEVVVAFQVASLKKTVRVVGDRRFFKSIASVEMTKPAPFERIPLRWERAFGGWDLSNPDMQKHTFEGRNPVGVGYRGSGTRFEEGLRAPNLEDPTRAFKGWGDRPPPAGFGFTSPNWEPRAKYAGTYDDKWSTERSPLVPKDFDRRFLSAASPGMVAHGYLQGGEVVVVGGVASTGPLAFRLPAIAPPTFLMEHAGREDQRVTSHLDTVIVNTDEAKVFLFWRGQVTVREPNAVRSLRIEIGAGTAPVSSAATQQPS